jgi:hypothetical protein
MLLVAQVVLAEHIHLQDYHMLAEEEVVADQAMVHLDLLLQVVLALVVVVLRQP